MHGLAGSGSEKHSALELPRDKGVYLLELVLASGLEVRVAGRSVFLEPGVYLYVGSAGGPGGLRARVARHLRRCKRIRWHIDLLTTSPLARVVAVYYAVGVYGTSYEACVSRCLERWGLKPIPGFGSTDDKASRSHLYRASRGKRVGEVAKHCLENCVGRGISYTMLESYQL